MKKRFTAAAALLTTMAVILPAAASAAPASGAVTKCQSQIKAVGAAQKNLTQKYLNPYFVIPANFADYPYVKLKGVGGVVSNFRSAVAAAGPYKGKTNFVLANDRYKTDATFADKAGTDVKALYAATTALDQTITEWSASITSTSNSLYPGSIYSKGVDYGMSKLAARPADQKLIAPADLTFSMDFNQCDTAAGRANVSFLMKRQAIAERSAKKGVASARKQLTKVKFEYAKVVKAAAKQQPVR